MEKMSMFKQMIEFEIDLLTFRLLSKCYNKLNYEAVFLIENKIVIAYYQGLDDWEAYCLN
jgi:hypothetical protein